MGLHSNSHDLFGKGIADLGIGHLVRPHQIVHTVSNAAQLASTELLRFGPALCVLVRR